MALDDRAAALRASRSVWFRRFTLADVMVFCRSFVLATPVQAFSSTPQQQAGQAFSPASAAQKPALNATIPHLNLAGARVPAGPRRLVAASPPCPGVGAQRAGV